MPSGIGVTAQMSGERPCYVEFELRAEEDRNASIEAGHFVSKDVEVAVVTPQGGSLVVDKNVKEWFDQLRNRGDQFLELYERQYKAWKEGLEEPLDGTPIRNWSPATPAQIQNCIQARIRTVEDLATASDEGLKRLGMGGRALQSKAVAWIESANDHGKVAEKISSLESKMEDQEKEIERLGELLELKNREIQRMQLEEEEEEEPTPRRRRRPKIEE